MAVASARDLREQAPELAVAAAALLRCAEADARGLDPAEVVRFSEEEEACTHFLVSGALGEARGRGRTDARPPPRQTGAWALPPCPVGG